MFACTSTTSGLQAAKEGRWVLAWILIDQLFKWEKWKIECVINGQIACYATFCHFFSLGLRSWSFSVHDLAIWVCSISREEKVGEDCSLMCFDTAVPILNTGFRVPSILYCFVFFLHVGHMANQKTERTLFFGIL